MRIIIIYDGNFGKIILDNLTNLPGFCTPCGESCNQCRVESYCGGKDVVSVVDSPDEIDTILPESLKGDIAIVVNLRFDVLLRILPRLKKAGIKGILGCSETPSEIPLNSWKEIEKKSTGI